MTAAKNATEAGKRGNPTKSSVPYTQASTQRRARERSVAIQTLLLVRKSKSSSVKSKTAEALMILIYNNAVLNHIYSPFPYVVFSFLLEEHTPQLQSLTNPLCRLLL